MSRSCSAHFLAAPIGGKRVSVDLDLLAFLLLTASPSTLIPSFFPMTPASPTHNDGPPSTHSSPTRFLSLPRELQTDIFSKACYSDQTLNHLDVKTTQKLMLICKDLHLVAAALLYKNVRVTRPSILAELVQTLKARPELGAMIKNLHLGAHCSLDPSWWPIENLHYWYNPRFMTSLTDEKLLPRWCCLHHDFMPKHPRYTYDHRERAVVAAVEAAQRAFGVDVDGRSWSCAPQLFGSLPWLAGVLEVQAAMDLYLIEMRRLEDDAARPKQSNDCKKCQQESSLQSGPCISYPSLQVLPNVACPPFGGKKTFVVTHKDILDHLARRGALLDSFESPLLLARSGLQILTFDSAWQARVSPHVLQRATLLYHGGKFADSFGSPSSRRATWLLSSVTPFSAESYATSTAGGILALARTLLALSTSVHSLFITGFIQQLVCGSNRVQLSSLCNLLLGPLTHAHGDSLAPTIKGTPLAALERLIVRGPNFGKQKAAAILALAQPKNVRWEMEWGEDSADE